MAGRAITIGNKIISKSSEESNGNESPWIKKFIGRKWLVGSKSKLLFDRQLLLQKACIRAIIT